MAAIGILFLVVSNGIKSAFFRCSSLSNNRRHSRRRTVARGASLHRRTTETRRGGRVGRACRQRRKPTTYAIGAAVPRRKQAAAGGAGGSVSLRVPPSAGRVGRLCSVSLRVRRAAAAVASGNLTRSTVHPLLIAYLDFFLRSTQRKSRTACPCRVRSMLKKECSRNICRKHRAKIKVSVL